MYDNTFTGNVIVIQIYARIFLDVRISLLYHRFLLTFLNSRVVQQEETCGFRANDKSLPL